MKGSEPMSSRFLIVFADILLPLALGMGLRKWGLSREILRLVIKANVVVVATFLSVVSFWSVHVTRELLWLPVSIIPICFLPVLVFYLFEKKRFTSPLDQGSYMISMMLGNIGTLAGLCAYVLYGERGFAYVQLIAVPPCIISPLSSRRRFTSAKIFSPIWCFSRRCRNFSRVVASGTCSWAKSIRMKERIA